METFNKIRSEFSTVTNSYLAGLPYLDCEDWMQSQNNVVKVSK